MNIRVIGLGLVLGIVLGCGGVYLINSQEIQELQDEITYLESPDRLNEWQLQLDQCVSEYETLENSYETIHEEYLLEQGHILQLVLLRADYNDLITEYEDLQDSLTELKTSSDLLLSNYQERYQQYLKLDELEEINEMYHDLHQIKEMTVAEPITEISYSIQAGEMKVFTFSLPYGIIIEEEMTYSGGKFTNMVSWKKDEKAGMITGGGHDTAEGYPTLDIDMRLTYYIDRNSIVVQLNWTSNYTYLHSNAYVRIGIP